MHVDTIEWLTRHRTTVVVGGADRWRLHYSETGHVQSPSLLLNTRSKKEAAEPASLTSCWPLFNPTILAVYWLLGHFNRVRLSCPLKPFRVGLRVQQLFVHTGGSQPGGRGTFIPSAFGTQEEELLPVCCQWEPIPCWRKMMG